MDAVVNHPLERNNLVAGLREIYDFERLSARVASGRANGKDLVALKNTLGALPEIRNTLEELASSALLAEIRDSIDDFDDLYQMIAESIVEEPPFIITEGNLIRPGYSSELDDLKGCQGVDCGAGAERAGTHRNQDHQGGIQQGVRILSGCEQILFG